MTLITAGLMSNWAFFSFLCFWKCWNLPCIVTFYFLFGHSADGNMQGKRRNGLLYLSLLRICVFVNFKGEKTCVTSYLSYDINLYTLCEWCIWYNNSIFIHRDFIYSMWHFMKLNLFTVKQISEWLTGFYFLGLLLRVIVTESFQIPKSLESICPFFLSRTAWPF